MITTATTLLVIAAIRKVRANILARRNTIGATAVPADSARAEAA